MPLYVCIQTGFSMEEILRKYIRYTLNEKPFNPDMVIDLIHLRNSSLLEDAQVAEILNEVSRRIVKEKGDVITLVLLEHFLMISPVSLLLKHVLLCLL